MPSNPRMPADPTTEELSAYLDNELEAGEQSRLAEHIAGCADCRMRLDGLRQAAHAIRALPMETPRRTFTLPAPERRPSRNWAPAGWVGGAAVALVAVVVGLNQLHFPASSPTSSGSTAQFGAAGAGQKQSEPGAAVPASSSFDRNAVPPGLAYAHGSAVADAPSGRHRLSISTEQPTYPASGSLRVSVILQGSPSASLKAAEQGITLTLMRGGTGILLSEPVGIASWDGTPVFAATYRLADLPLTEPRAGDYQVVATWVIPDGSGRILQASVPVRLTN